MWSRLNRLEMVKPMVWLNELPWNEMEVDGELTLRTSSPFCQRIESELLQTIYLWEHLPVDMVVLSVALEAHPDAEAVARMFNISRSADGFFLERHPKLDPVATTTDGTFVAGCCQGPKDIPDTVAQASAAAAEVLAMISKGTIEIEAATAVINERICSGCQICKLVCPYGAILFDEEREVCRVNEALCKGCGICVSGCPSDSITLNHFTNEQIVAQMEGMLV